MTDWARLGQKLMSIQAVMIHDEQTDLRGSAFTGEALRRLLEGPGSGFVEREYHMHVLDLNRKQDRANGERAQELLKIEREEYARKLADARGVLAKAIRARCNEATVPSRYRREGVLLAADWLDGKGA